MKFRKLFSLPFLSAFEGEPKNHYQEVVSKLGFSQEEIVKLEKGETTLEDVVNSYVSKTEQTVAERIRAEVEKTKKSEIFGGAYAKLEKQLADEFGIDLAKYEGVDKTERTKTILSDLKKAQLEKVKELESKYSSADAQKLKQLQEQLDLANNTISAKEQAMLDAIAAEQSKLKNYVKTQHINAVRGKLIESVKDARLEPAIMRAVLDANIMQKGYDFEIEEGETNRIWVLKDGDRVKNPTKPTENLTYESLFEIVSAENTFVKQSNGGSSSRHAGSDNKTEGINSKRLQHLQKYNKD